MTGRRPFPARLRRAVTGAASAALMLAALAGPGWAAGGGGSSGEPTRDQAAEIPGRYIMLNPVWVPVRDTARDRVYSGGLLIRLEPAEGFRVDACYLVPRLMHEIVVSFFEEPLTRRELMRKEPARKRIQDIVDRLTDDPVVAGISVFDQMPELDEASVKLSRACR